MPPNITTATAMFLATPASADEQPAARKGAETPGVPAAASSSRQPPSASRPEYKWVVSWRNVLGFVYLHAGALYGIYLVFTSAMLKTSLFGFMTLVVSAMGITAGAHRLWAHKTYKATWQLRTILAVLQTIAFQNHIYEWVRDHRVHHKFCDTDADPHNSRRGFFFCHMGWLMIRKHPDVKAKGQLVDMSDLDQDMVVVWQKKVYLFVMPFLCFFIPCWIPIWAWGEDSWTSWYVVSIARYTLTLHGTWLVNSAAHLWGMKPYDKSISSVENKYVGVAALGEGWHNYHHTFPWDYKTAELGNYRANLTTAFINFFAKVGWAYDLKTVSAEMVRKRATRTGDGSWEGLKEAHEQDDGAHHHHHDGKEVWGWDDKDMLDEDIKSATILNKKK